MCVCVCAHIPTFVKSFIDCHEKSETMATQKSLIMRFVATVSACKFFISHHIVSKDHIEFSSAYLCVADDGF